MVLTDVADLRTGHTPSRNHPEYWNGDIPWIGIRDAGAHHGGVIYDTSQSVTELGLENSAAVLLPRDTVCLSRTASVGYVVKMGREMATSQDFVNWVCSPGLHPDYLMKALLAEGQDIRRFGEGSTHTTIYFPEVKAFHIDLPPPAEQKRIVAKLDALSAKSARARTELARIETLVFRYKQAVLSQAFSADTTQGWDNAPLEQLSDTIFDGPFGSNLKSTDYTSEGPRVIRLENIAARTFLEEKRTYVSREKFDSLIRHQIKPGDLLFSSFVSEEIRACLFPADPIVEAINKADCFCVRLDSDKIEPKFALLQITTQETYRYFVQQVHGATRPRINLAQLKQYPVSVPSLGEQREIIHRIESAFARIDCLAAEAKRALDLVGKLDEAILAKAFRGELVPQDENDEPADVSLDRIRAERASAPKVKRRGRTAAARS